MRMRRVEIRGREGDDQCISLITQDGWIIFFFSTPLEHARGSDEKKKVVPIKTIDLIKTVSSV